MTDQPARSRIRILIAAVDAEFRRNLCRSLGYLPGFDVVAEASEGSSAVHVALRHPPHVFIIDLQLPARTDLENLLRASPARVVALTSEMKTAEVLEAVQLGAHGILPKTAGPAILRDCVRTVADGKHWLEPEAAAVVMEHLRKTVCPVDVAKSPNVFSLTPRERQIIAKITAGCSNRMVGEQFSISERTVKHHLTNIYNKIGVSNRLGLALFAVNHQLLDTL